MHRPRNALGGVIAVAVAAIAFSGSAVAGNGHGSSPGNSGNAPGQLKKQGTQQTQSVHGSSANAPGHTKHSKSTSGTGAIYPNACEAKRGRGGRVTGPGAG